MARGNDRLVFSTGPQASLSRGKSGCPRCGSDPCRCEPSESRPPLEHKVHVRMERAGRKGKTVTVATPFFLERSAAADLLQSLKRRCGCGGALKTDRAPNGSPCFVLEIQGDHVETVRTELQAAGYR